MSKNHYWVCLGRRADYPHPAPERTAYRPGPGIFSDDEYRVWTNRAAMAKAVRMSERGENSNWYWRAMVPLAVTEGY
jgi:hypothetical protein